MTQKIILLLLNVIAAFCILGCNEEDIKPQLSTFEFETSLEEFGSDNVNINLISAYTYDSYDMNGNKYDAEYRSYLITDGKYIPGKNIFETISYKNATYFLYINTVNPMNESFTSTDFPLVVYGKSCSFTLRKAGNFTEWVSKPNGAAVASIALDEKNIEIIINNSDIWQFVYDGNNEFVETLDLNASLIIKGTINDLSTL